ncbi:MAG: alpha/beta hydrolase [Verrucomicrobiota bacterium]
MKALPALLVMAAFTSGCAKMIDYDEAIVGLKPTEVIEVGHQRVHVRQWGETGEPIVLIHGFAVSSYAFRELGPLLGRSHRVAAVDLNGFGYTERPDVDEAYSLEGQAALIRRVQKELGFRRAHLVGHSYGGYLVTQIAATTPESCGSVLLISPALGIEVAPSGFVRSPVFRKAMYPALKGVLGSRRMFRSLYERAYFDQSVLSEEVAEEYRRQLRVEGLNRAYRGFGSSLGEVAVGEAATLEQVSVPVMVIAGEQDQIIRLEALESELEGVRDVKLRAIPESGHSSPEEKPEEVAREILGFLREHPLEDH